jgi:hypothetical protein
VLSIAARDEAARLAASVASGRSGDVIEDAAAFCIEQVLLYPEADSCRVLGASTMATAAELRRNMALFMRWVHPDLDPKGHGRCSRPPSRGHGMTSNPGAPRRLSRRSERHGGCGETAPTRVVLSCEVTTGVRP